MYVCVYSCIYRLLILTISIKKVLDKFFNGGVFRAQSDIQQVAFCKLVYCFLERGVVWNFQGGFEYDPGLTNDFLFFFFMSWNVSLWSACKYLWWRLVLCGDQTIDLQDELIGQFLYGLGFCRGYFRADYSIVLFTSRDKLSRFIGLLNFCRGHFMCEMIFCRFCIVCKQLSECILFL